MGGRSSTLTYNETYKNKFMVCPLHLRPQVYTGRILNKLKSISVASVLLLGERIHPRDERSKGLTDDSIDLRNDENSSALMNVSPAKKFAADDSDFASRSPISKHDPTQVSVYWCDNLYKRKIYHEYMLICVGLRSGSLIEM